MRETESHEPIEVSTTRCARYSRLSRLVLAFVSKPQVRRRALSRFGALLIGLIAAGEAHAVTDTFNASGTWTAPAGVTSATVEAWGGGGAGGGATGNPAQGGGGAGGQYAKKVVSVTSGTNYAVVVGAGGTAGTGTGGAGGDSTFATNVVVAKGGAGGGGAATNGGDGAAAAGSATGGVGDTVFAGGSGAVGVATTSCGSGGAGGGGAGSGGAGGAGSGLTGGAGTATGGGDGGDGRNSSGNGNAGSVLGGAGAGACAETNTDRTGGAGAAGRVTVTYTVLPAVTSINRASTNPARADDVVSWTVVFNMAVTGVDATDFALVQGGGVSGASITSVTGSGTTWTVTANPGGTNTGTLGLNLVDNDSIVNGATPLGGAGGGNGNFTGQVYTITAPFCSPPANVPAGVTVSCQCDRFGRASLNPSTIYGSDWIVSTSDTTGIVPYINATSGLLRLTENTGNNAKAATVPGIFPAAGNYISVEFQHYSYGGTGADGIAVTLSDYAVPAVPGAFGGSLGYAQKNQASCGVTGGCPGFAGGWIGVAIDEFGNFQSPTEGRIGGPGQRADSVSIRGSGDGQNGYNYLAGTAANLSPAIDSPGGSTPLPGYYYQVIVDARSEPTSTSVTVNRDTTGSGTYSTLINVPNVYTTAAGQGFTQTPVPANWQISFTGSTGGSTNVHEIGGVKICSQVSAPPSGGTASGFNAIDEAYATPPATPAVQNFLNGHVYTKLMGTPFKLWVAALNNNQIQTTYAAGSNKTVSVKIVDNSDGACVLDSSQANYCSATCKAKSAITGGSQNLTFTSSDAGKKQSADFTLNTAYKNLAVIMGDGTTTACSTDAFSVRPTTASVSVTTTQPIKAGTNFAMTATINGVGGATNGYTGVLKINSNAVTLVSPATVVGAFAPATFPAAVSGTTTATASGTTFTYSEAGSFTFSGYDPASDTASPRAIYDGVSGTTECASPVTVAQCDTLRAATWTGVDSISSKGDCVLNSYANTKDASGKYGCNFGINANAGPYRFIPDHFALINAQTITNRSDLACPSATFTYLGEPFRLMFQLAAQNAANVITKNYVGTNAKLDVTVGSQFGVLTGNTATLNSRVTATALGSNIWQTGVSAGTTNTLGVDVTVARRSDGVPDGAFDGTEIGIAPQDSDGVVLNLLDRNWDAVAGNEHRLFGTTNLRYGRLAVQNAFGSELIALPVPVRAQYYESASSGFITNTVDNCTPITLSSISLTSAVETKTANNPIKVKNTVTTQASSAATLVSGDAGFSFSAPGSGGDGYVDITNTNSITPIWLRYDWDGNSGTAETGPTGRATFGIYRGSPRNIYLRERY